MTVLMSDGFDSLHCLIPHIAEGGVGAEWSVGPWQNMNGEG